MRVDKKVRKLQNYVSVRKELSPNGFVGMCLENEKGQQVWVQMTRYNELKAAGRIVPKEDQCTKS